MLYNVSSNINKEISLEIKAYAPFPLNSFFVCNVGYSM